ncbi:MAG: TetR/AcrR family transcriptional regulator [Proteobacteria bacterium]|nr:MAG: TetR/AcrR family transcriptional regulator [Pseudomonadota bacterium]
MHSETQARRAPRQDNRRRQLLDAAAGEFRGRGFHAVTMRDIARSADMIAGSIYYHFGSKEDLFLAVYEEGVRRISERVSEAVEGAEDPWERLARACRAHTGMLLEESDYAQVILRVFPEDVSAVRERLVELRDGYERLFRVLVDDLPLASGVDRSTLRRMLLGALNWAKFWYRPGGMPPQAIADRMLELLKESLVSNEAT